MDLLLNFYTLSVSLAPAADQTWVLLDSWGHLLDSEDTY